MGRTTPRGQVRIHAPDIFGDGYDVVVAYVVEVLRNSRVLALRSSEFCHSECRVVQFEGVRWSVLRVSDSRKMEPTVGAKLGEEIAAHIERNVDYEKLPDFSRQLFQVHGGEATGEEADTSEPPLESEHSTHTPFDYRQKNVLAELRAVQQELRELKFSVEDLTSENRSQCLPRTGQPLGSDAQMQPPLDQSGTFSGGIPDIAEAVAQLLLDADPKRCPLLANADPEAAHYGQVMVTGQMRRVEHGIPGWDPGTKTSNFWRRC